MAHQVDDNCHHIWIHYPSGEYSRDFDVLIRLKGLLCQQASGPLRHTEDASAVEGSAGRHGGKGNEHPALQGGLHLRTPQ